MYTPIAHTSRINMYMRRMGFGAFLYLVVVAQSMRVMLIKVLCVCVDRTKSTERRRMISVTFD